MPIQPIDMQTMFVRMHEIGKDQSAQKDVSQVQQAITASEIVKKTEEKDRTVNETNSTGEGIDRVKEEEEKKQGKERNKQNAQAKEKEGEEKKKSFFQDPNLGRHIDISG